MRLITSSIILTIPLIFSSIAKAESAVDFFGRDISFPNKVPGLPQKLSEVAGLKIREFTTNDKVKIRYWEAGTGKPLIIVPGWGTNGAWLINDIALLSNSFHVYVIDPRNQGLSQKVDYGNNIARFAKDVNELTEHLNIDKAYFCGWSMGASVLWSYIDLFGTDKMEKVAFVDEPPSVYSHTDWPEEDRLKAGAFVVSTESAASSVAYGTPVNSFVAAWPTPLPETPASENSNYLVKEVISIGASDMKKVLFDHISNDWTEVIKYKIDIPTAVFAANDPVRLPSQKWMAEVIPHAQLFAYIAKDSGDHDLMIKNPIKFSRDLTQFLNQ